MKTRLHIDYDYEFCLIGIVCSEQDYRLCWALNSALNLHLAKTEEHEAEFSKHSLFSYAKEELFREYFLLANKGESFPQGGEYYQLIEEHKHLDYFLIIKGSLEEEEKKHITELIKKQDIVSAAYLIDVISLKGKQNLIL